MCGSVSGAATLLKSNHTNYTQIVFKCRKREINTLRQMRHRIRRLISLPDDQILRDRTIWHEINAVYWIFHLISHTHIWYIIVEYLRMPELRLARISHLLIQITSLGIRFLRLARASKCQIATAGRCSGSGKMREIIKLFGVSHGWQVGRPKSVRRTWNALCATGGWRNAPDWFGLLVFRMVNEWELWVMVFFFLFKR